MKHSGGELIRKESLNVKSALKETKKKGFNQKDIEDLTISLRSLSIAKENIVIEQFITGIKFLSVFYVQFLFFLLVRVGKMIVFKAILRTTKQQML